MSGYNKSINGFPSQKKSKSQKSKKWAKQCVDYGDNSIGLHDEGVRQSRRNKIINLNLYNGRIERNELSNYVNPNRTSASYIYDDLPHHPIVVPKIDLLVGEEFKRRFDCRVIVTNPDAISRKEEEIKEMWSRKIQEIVEDEDMSEEEVQKQLNKFNKYVTHEYQDVRELRANRLLRHYYKELNLKNLFNKGFKDALIFGEEIYQCDLVSNEPYFSRLNPINVHTVRTGGSDRVEDSDLIIIDEYWTPGKIIDHYYDRLKSKDITNIESGYTSTTKQSDEHVGSIHQQPDLWVQGEDVDNYVNLAEIYGHTMNKYRDLNGNLRVLRVYWRSLRKIKKVTYFDEDGDEQIDYYPEDYIPKEELGEIAETLWINEWWEGVKIGEDIYINMRPRPIQYNQIDNPSLCNPGIVGEIYSTGQGKAVSMIDRAKGFQYLYDALWDRLNKAISKNLGAIMELDLAKVPENWSVEKWMHFAVANGIAVVDSFKEGNKGHATGKLAGNFNTTGRVLNHDMGNYIEQHINLLAFVKAEMSEIVGVSPQREGAIENRETVGGVERSVMQSSHITEYWFARHEDVKRRAMTLLIETAKIAMRGRSKKLQFVAEDNNIAFMDIDGDEFAECSYGLVVDSGVEYNELERAMKELAHAGIQNDKMNFSTLLEIYLSPSLMDIKRKIEKSEQEKEEADRSLQEQQNQIAQQQIQVQAQIEEAKLTLDRENNVRDNETKLAVELLKQEGNADIDGDGIEEDSALDLQKHKDELMLKIRELDDKMRMHNDKMEREDEKIKVSKKKASSPSSN